MKKKYFFFLAGFLVMSSLVSFAIKVPHDLDVIDYFGIFLFSPSIFLASIFIESKLIYGKASGKSGESHLKKQKTFFYILCCICSFFLFQSCYEIFILTYQRGPQMIFFSLIHGSYSKLWTGLVWGGIIFYPATIFHALIMILVRVFRREFSLRVEVWIYVIAIFIMAHFALLVSYEWWTPLFLR